MKILLIPILLGALVAQPLRVQLVTGGHDHEPSLYALFDNQPEFKTNVRPHPQAFTSDLRRNTDVLVLYDMIKTGLPEDKRARLREFAEAGKGIVILHHAICSHTDWPWWFEQVAGGVYNEKSTFLHDETMPIKIVKKHPITDGLADFVIHDETYKNLWISPKVDVLLRTSNPTSDGPVAWISPYPKSRVVFLQLGHGPEAHRNPNFQRLVRQAILWAGERSEPTK